MAPALPDYVDDNDPDIPLRGEFNIDTYLGWLNAPNATSETSTLQRLGFVSGFGHVWMQKTSSHLLLEAVIAFSGASGARRWMSRSEALDKTDSTYAHPIAVGGLGSYYAWHGADPSGPEYADYVSFVKGNDFFIVIADSTFDDLGNTASVQSKKQFDSAPAYTVPPAQWPENSTRSLLYYFLVLLPNLILFGAMLIFVLAVIGVVLWAHRRKPPPVVLSPDGYYWWDGQTWRPVSR